MRRSPALNILVTSLMLLTLISAQPAEETTEGKTLAVSGHPEIYNDLTLGIGHGTLAVVIACIIGVIICFFKDCVAVPNVCVTIAIIIPLLTLLIVRLLPIKGIDNEDDLPVS